jgi:hypothetical protein
MRITLNFHDDALKILRDYSRTQSLTLGKAAASELIRSGSSIQTPTRMVKGIYMFRVPKGGRKITHEDIQRLLDADDLADTLRIYIIPVIGHCNTAGVCGVSLASYSSIAKTAPK